ncbi:MAG: hypothetical protein HC844_07145 [Tabrizicola sp.]|nr:hypothetical protein [Tabrizicola sp.]
MTTIITRLYSDTATAQAVAETLVKGGHGETYIDVITQDGSGALHDRLHRARVNARSAATYAGAIAAGNALLVVRAPFNPIGAARHAMRIVDRTPSIKVGVADENEYIREQPTFEVRKTVLTDHPRFMSHDLVGRDRGTVSSAFGLRLLSARGTKTSAISGGGYMSTKLLPFPLLSRKKDRGSVIHGGWTLSSIFGIPTTVRR